MYYFMPVVAYLAAQAPTNQAFCKKSADHLREKLAYLLYTVSFEPRPGAALFRRAISAAWDNTTAIDAGNQDSMGKVCCMGVRLSEHDLFRRAHV